MSAVSEERGSKRGNTEARPVGSQRPSATSRDSNTQNRRGGKGGIPSQTVNSRTPETLSTPNLPPQDEHVPLNAFNIVEVDDLLKRGFDTKAPVYKPETQPQKPGSVWGAKVGAMASGKDFWLELRKQVTALQQTGGVSQGG